MDALVFFTNFTGTPRGTHCFRTPNIIRLSRILCPNLIKPIRLARRPTDQEHLGRLGQYLTSEVIANQDKKLDDVALSEPFYCYTALKIAGNLFIIICFIFVV